jgi:AcrR family transcriptional regulator
MGGSPPAPDGRALRGERNREQIVEAIIALLRSGETRPTAEQVAQRAKVGARTVFRHFADMESLYAAVNDRLAQEVLPLLAGARFTGSVRERVAELVRCRAKIFERIAPMRRREDSREARSPAVQEGRADLDRVLREQLRQALGRELDEAGADRSEALDALLSWETWDRLRTRQRLGGARAARVLEDTALALLGAARGGRR